ncbi:hypothetical protein B6S12_00815, partial [Helicobacter valdiviensis]
MYKTKSLSNSLALIVCLFIALTLIVVSVYSYLQSKNNAYELIGEVQNKTVDDVLKFFTHYHKANQESIKAIADEIAKNPNRSLEELHSLLRTQAQSSNFALMYIGLEENGAMIRSNGNHQMPQDGYDPRSRSWYKDAKAFPNKVSTSDPYIAPSLKAPSMSYSYPIIVNGKFIGAVGGNYDLSKFSSDVLSMGRSRDGNTSVLSKDGTILFHDITEKMLTQTTLSKNIINAYKDLSSNNKANIQKPFIVSDDEGINKAILCKIPQDTQFFMCTIINENVYTDTINSIFIKQMIVGVIAIIISLVLIKIIINTKLKPLSSIQNGLSGFFSYLNHESKNAPKPISVTSNDEFGIMAKVINANIEKTKIGLEQDLKAVTQSVQTAKAIEEGDLSARIIENPANPQLVELKNVLNNMLSTLESKVGSNMNEITKVFDSYKNLDFSIEIKDAKGEVELTTNTLGEEIKAMLRASASFAQDLAKQSEELKISMEKLTSGSQTQASSLQQSAAAIEEISSSMQNVSDKTSE